MKINKDDVIYFIVTHVSRSGMSRTIKFLMPYVGTDTPKNGSIVDVSYQIAEVLKWKLDKHGNGIKVTGCGMDMGFHTINSLGYKLFNDGYALKSRQL